MTRSTTPLERLLLLAGYVGVLLVPLALIAQVMKPGAQGALVVLADVLGYAALSLLVLQIAISGRWAWITRVFGLRSVLALHRQAGLTVLALVGAHLAVLFLDDPSRLSLLNSLTAPPRARAAMVALLGLLLIGATSAWRRRLGLSYERWRAVHLAATALVIAATFAHVLWVDAYSSAPLVRWTVLGLVLAAAVALFWMRVARPYASALRPYRVRAIQRERGDAVTLDLVAVGHDGLRFAPGQFAWLRAPHCVYGMNDHPFSLSSDALAPERPSFTVKALGDFSSSLADLRPGTEVLVDGPHGEGHHDAGVRGRLLVVAGIGITPAVSVIRTALRQGDGRPLRLVYGSRRWADVTFREELDALARSAPQLEVVHVLSRPEPGWRGERGRIDAGVVRRHAPRDVAGWSALVCGPPAMVAGVTVALRGLGVPPGRIQAEGFG